MMMKRRFQVKMGAQQYHQNGGHARDIQTRSDRELVFLLQKDPTQRTVHEINRIWMALRPMGAFGLLRDSALRSLCRVIRYERHDANDILYCRGELCSCWYVLLCGSVFIDGSMYLPGAR
ncbi:putative Rap guanine nucleotide exchange factor 6 [Daphnia magna]|uniref:Uncharacterized protein n=2 Tax=Daphnia magna TaxID=35525 RepID=A0ABQ9ZIV3_9CRUS|nr:hypothetical protein OUZ56_025106 [Daphnia magna]KZS09247.1 putative Rap guanine nucleotide exchange factor 6 [Daphnia magna]